MFEEFVAHYGAPRQGTAVDLEALGLGHSSDLQHFVSEVGSGVFADGLLSIASVRERVDGLDAWQGWLPEHSRLFASSAFGFLMVTRGSDVWIVNTQYGEIMETELTIHEAIVQCAQPSTRDDLLRAPTFQLWSQLAGPLPPDSVLCPTPAIALGGTWAATTLSTMTLPAYLSFTGQLFSAEGGLPANIHRLEPLLGIVR